ncbi:hypothetical protein DL764_004675 [Monosporascus ibericus]|uniref:Myb-like domain-containing protein n=1 Tax=Monosporascus ibericus TaxID=155417 RepID=A0A4Q4TBP5_9PEZI|nr:hypothetical protein DL764_004675 [Monosporascus ibericus]
MPYPDAATYKGGESEVEPADRKLGLRRKRKAVRRPSHGPYSASFDNDSDSDSYGNPRDDSDEKDYQPPIESSKGEQDKEEDDNGVRPTPRKRSKIDSPTHATLNNTFAQRLRPRGHISQTRKFQTPARGRKRSRRQTIPSPPSSHTSNNDQGSMEPDFAKFEEWPLENAYLKRVTENLVTTFQLQFSWDSCTKNGHETRNRRDPPKSRGVAFTEEEDDLLIKLKRQELSWQETYEQFTENFPGRSKGTLQVRYCTKLKGRRANKVGSP